MIKDEYASLRQIVRWGLEAYECYRNDQANLDGVGEEGWWRYDDGARAMGAIMACIHHRIDRHDEVMLIAARVGQVTRRMISNRLLMMEGNYGFWTVDHSSGIYRLNLTIRIGE
jgi:hypothetical protein